MKYPDIFPKLRDGIAESIDLLPAGLSSLRESLVGYWNGRSEPSRETAKSVGSSLLEIVGLLLVLLLSDPDVKTVWLIGILIVVAMAGIILIRFGNSRWEAMDENVKGLEMQKTPKLAAGCLKLKAIEVYLRLINIESVYFLYFNKL